MTMRDQGAQSSAAEAEVTLDSEPPLGVHAQALEIGRAHV